MDESKPSENVNSKNASKQKRRVYFNLVHFALVFFFIFTAYRALESIQSSLHFEAGRGATSLSILYAGFFVSCLFIGAPLIFGLGAKWGMFVSCLPHTIYILANASSRRIALFPASFLLGLVSSAIWIGQGAYITLLAQQYVDVTGARKDIALQKVNSWFYVIYGFSGPVGNMASGIVLNWNVQSHSCASDPDFFNTTDAVLLENQTISPEYCIHGNESTLDRSICGPNHCPYMKTHLSVMEKPEQKLVCILLLVFLAFNITGIILCGLLHNVKSEQISSPLKKLVSVAKVMKLHDMQLMLMTYVHMAMVATMFYGSFLQSFVSCTFGITMVGYTMLAQGLGFTAFTMLLSQIIHIVPAQLCVSLSIATDLATSISWLLWQPQPDQFWVVLIYAVVNGMVQAVYKVQFGAMTSLLFENNIEAAFAHYNLWGGITHCIGFALTSRLCFVTKGAIYITSVCLLALSYFILQVTLFLRKAKSHELEIINKDVKTDLLSGKEKPIDTMFYSSQTQF